MNDTVILTRRRSWWHGIPYNESVICGLGRAFGYIRIGYRIDWEATERAHQAAGRSTLQEDA